jgi:hypothetical protein
VINDPGCGSRIESHLPNRDLAVAHGPGLNAKSLHSLTRAGVFEIRIPSERAFRSRKRALREGRDPYPAQPGWSWHLDNVLIGAESGAPMAR